MTVKRRCMKLTFKGLSGNSYINDSRRYDCWSFVRAFLCARNASRAWFLWLTGLATRSSRISSRKSLNRSWNTARHQDSRKKLQQTNRQPNEKRINKQMRCGPDKFTNEKQKAKTKECVKKVVWKFPATSAPWRDSPRVRSLSNILWRAVGDNFLCTVKADPSTTPPPPSPLPLIPPDS